MYYNYYSCQLQSFWRSTPQLCGNYYMHSNVEWSQTLVKSCLCLFRCLHYDFKSTKLRRTSVLIMTKTDYLLDQSIYQWNPAIAWSMIQQIPAIHDNFSIITLIFLNYSLNHCFSSINSALKQDHMFTPRRFNHLWWRIWSSQERGEEN